MAKLYYIKERHNPQLGVYYVPCGQLSKRAAKRNEDSLYGFNIMHGYATQEEYDKAVSALKESGENVH